ncbi:hypothetical protein [uncultured Ellagibacter sp.]|nr:hypothetical protein [uncultured Ellagibacter sp.]
MFHVERAEAHSHDAAAVGSHSATAQKTLAFRDARGSLTASRAHHRED